MPIHYERDDGRRRIVETSTGTVTIEDMLKAVERQLADGAWSYGVLTDARAIVRGPAPEELHQFLLRIGEMTCDHGPRGRTAIVVADQALAQMGEKFARLSELAGLEVRVFATIAAAESWLESGLTT